MSTRNPLSVSNSLVGGRAWGYAAAVRLDAELQAQRSVALMRLLTAPVVALVAVFAGLNGDTARRVARHIEA